MEHYTYIWRDATGVPFYVGKGKGKRAWSLSKRSKEFKYIHAQGGCAVEIVDLFIHESQAHANEMELIERFGRREMGGLLVNKTDGGEGTSGVIRSAETRARLSRALIGNKNVVGRILSPESRAKIGATKLGNTYFLGKEHSAEARSKIADAARGNKNMLGYTHSEEARAKMSAAQANRTVSEGTRLKLSLANLGKEISAETRAKISLANKGKSKPPFSPEHREGLARAKRMALPRSEFKGVCFITLRGTWRAMMQKEGGGQLYLGAFSSQEAAARAYDAAVIAAWGLGNCYLNFPDEVAA